MKSHTGNMKHTPGPWHWVNADSDIEWDGKSATWLSLRTIKEYGENKTEVIDGNSYTSFALPISILDVGEIPEEANAKLIAVSPDMLEGCISALECLKDGSKSQRRIQANIDFLTKTIEKAT